MFLNPRIKRSAQVERSQFCFNIYYFHFPNSVLKMLKKLLVLIITATLLLIVDALVGVLFK